MHKGKIFKNNVGMSGYFTVEASLIVPFIFALIMLSILLSFFLFNNCIVYQSCYIAALRGQQIKDVSDSGIEEYVNKELDKLLDEQIYRYQVDGRADVGIASISVTAMSDFENTLRSFGLYDEEKFDSRKTVKVVRINPTEVVRKKHIFDK